MKHGEFKITPHHHMNRGQGCSECKKMGLDGFLQKAALIHGNKYDYSEVIYINNKTKVKIICPNHDEFYIRVNDHINGSIGCAECTYDRFRKTKEEFIKESLLIHNYKYDYSMVFDFKSNKEKVIIRCPNHGKFKQRVDMHLRGQGCNDCRKVNFEDFIKECLIIHGGLYDYTKCSFTKVSDKIIITCRKHGDFTQRASSHKEGQGCPVCRISTGESKVLKWLKDNNINYKPQKTFEGCVYIRELKFDFYLPDYNICIEYNGEQHYKIVDFWGGVDGLVARKKRDNIKKKYCLDNDIELLIIHRIDDIEDKLNHLFM